MYHKLLNILGALLLDLSGSLMHCMLSYLAFIGLFSLLYLCKCADLMYLYASLSASQCHVTPAVAQEHAVWASASAICDSGGWAVARMCVASHQPD